MLLCWDKNAKKRPTFEALHNDFNDFDSTVQEKYDYAYEQFMNENLYTSDPTVAKTPARGRRRVQAVQECAGVWRKATLQKHGAPRCS